MGNREVNANQGETKQLQEGTWKFAIKALGEAIQSKKDGKSTSDILLDLDKAKRKLVDVDVGGSRASNFLQTAIDAYKKDKSDATLTQYSEGAKEIKKGLDRIAEEQKQAAQGFVAKTKESAPEDKKKDEPITSKNLKEDLETWKEKYKQLVEDYKAGDKAAGYIIGAASLFKMMVEDPLNDQYARFLKTARDNFLSDSQSGELGAAEKTAYDKAGSRFGEIFGVDLIKESEAFANKLVGMQRAVAVYDNVAPHAFNNWETLKPALAQADDARRTGASIPSGRDLGLGSYSLLYYEMRNRLLDQSATTSQPYSQYEMYKLISRNYMGIKEIPEAETGKREIFLVEQNEGLMNDPNKFVKEDRDSRGFFERREAFRKEFGSPTILAMDIRSQYDLFMKSKPAMENNGMVFDQKVIAEVEKYISTLEPRRQLPQLESFANQIATNVVSMPLNIDTFLKAFENGMKSATIDIVLPNGSPYTLEDANITVETTEFEKTVKLISPYGGSLVLGYSTEPGVPNKGTLTKVDDPTHPIEFRLDDPKLAMTYVVAAVVKTVPEYDLLKDLNLQLAGAGIDKMVYQQILLGAKLDGFFEHVMPRLCHFEQKRDVLFGYIYAGLTGIEDAYTSRDPLALATINDVSGARGALRDYMRESANLLGLDAAKWAAFSPLKMPGASVENMNIVDRVHHTMFPIYDELNEKGLINIPYFAPALSNVQNISGSSLRRRQVAPGLVPSHKRISHYEGMSVLPDAPQFNIPIEKFGADQVPAIGENLAKAVSRFLPEPERDLVFKSADFYHTGTLTGNELGSSVKNITRYREARGRNTVYQVDVDYSRVNVGSATIHARALNMSDLKLPLAGKVLDNVVVAEANAVVTEWVMKRMEAYLLANPTAGSAIAAYALKDNKTGAWTLNTAYASYPSRSKKGTSKASDEEGGLGPMTFEFYSQKMNTDEIASTFAGFDLKNPKFSPLARIAWQTDLKGGPSGPTDLAKRISQGDCTGFVIAANVGEDVGVAYLADLKEAKRVVSINRPMLAHTGQSGTTHRPYDTRKAVATFVSPNSQMGIFGDVMLDRQKSSDKKTRSAEYVSQIHGRVVWNDSFSFEGSANRTSEAAGKLNSFTGEARGKLGAFKLLGGAVYSDHAPLLLGPFALLDTAPYMGLTGGRFAMRHEDWQMVNFKYSFLRATEKKGNEPGLWQAGSSPVINSLYQGPDEGELAHSIGGYVGNNLVPFLKSSLSGIEEINRMGKAPTGGWAFVFKNESFKPTQISLQGLRDYNGLSIGGGQVTNIVFNHAGTQLMSIGLMGGKQQPNALTLFSTTSNKTTYGKEQGKKDIIAGGIRTQGLPFQEVMLGLDIANNGGPSNWEITGVVTYDDPKAALFNSMVFASVKDRDLFKHWFVENTFGGDAKWLGLGLGTAGTFAYYDEQKLTLGIQNRMTMSEMHQRSLGGGVYALSSTGWTNVKIGVTGKLLENKAIDFSRKSTSANMEFGYFRQSSEEHKPAILKWIPDQVSNATFNLDIENAVTKAKDSPAYENLNLTWTFTVSVRVGKK